MNTEYLMNLIAERLRTIVCEYSIDGELTYAVNKCYDTKEYAALMPGVGKFLLDMSDTDKMLPRLSSIDNHLIFCTVPTPRHTYLIGPVRFYSMPSIKHNLNMHHERDKMIDRVKFVAVSDYLFYVLLLRNLFYDNPIDEATLLLKDCVNQDEATYLDMQHYDALFDIHEGKTKHNPYEQEQRMLGAIEAGNLELLHLSNDEGYEGDFGQMATQEARSAKNVCIAAITLSSRAAIRGGVHPELAFSLCDTYVREIELISDLYQLQPLVEEAEIRFANIVKEIKAHQTAQVAPSYHPLVNKCKDYIFLHLHEKITLAQIAKELNVNPNYLSMLFHKCENVSFGKYMMQQKIELAKTTLIYTSFSYSEIAYQLGFASQSHFGKNFLEVVGMTPKQYRDRFKATKSDE